MTIMNRSILSRSALWSGLLPLVGFSLALAKSTASAAAISAGNLVVYRVGDGSAALGTTATAVFLDEYTPAGSLVQSIAAPTSGSTMMTAVGNSGTEGIISRSQDGTSLVFGGYRKATGGTNPSLDVPGTTNRVAATLSLGGILTTTVGLTDPTGNLRSVASVDGASQFYLGTSANVRYVATPGSAATSVIIDARNSREVLLSGNTLFASNGSTTITGKVQSYGTLPTTTTSASPIAVLALADAVHGFVLLDLDAGVAGDDTMYALSTVENLLRKYTFDGINWVASGSIAASGASNITGVATGATAQLYLTSATTISGVTDASGYNAAITGTLATIATAGTNTGFRGIGILVPEPSSALLLFGMLGLAARRKR